MTIEIKDGARLRLTVLASDVLKQYDDRFAFDFETLNVADRVPLDYDHDDAQIIGYAEGFDLTADAVTADAVLLSAPESPSTMAKAVDYNLRAGVPYEVSPLVDLDGAVATFIQQGEAAVVNGRDVVGPLTIYTSATIRGVAICPHGTDAQTSAFIAFKARTEKELPKMDSVENKKDDLVELNRKKCDSDAGGDASANNDQTSGSDASASSGSSDTPAAPETANGDAKKRKIDPELEALTAEFGREAGVDYYLRGYTIEDARAEDYAALKKLRDDLAKKDDETPTDDEKTDDESEKEKELSAKVASLETRLLALSALVRRGDDAGVSDNVQPAASVSDKKDPLRAAAERLAAMGTVRKF